MNKNCEVYNCKVKDLVVNISTKLWYKGEVFEVNVLRCFVVPALFICCFHLLYGNNEYEVAKDLIRRQIGQKAIKIRELFGGHSGAKVLKVDTPIGSYVVKFVNPCIFEREALSAIALAKKGVGPKVYFTDKENKVILMDFVKSVPIAVDDPLRLDPSLYRKLGELLKKIHSIRIRTGKVDVLERVSWQYQDLLATHKLSSKLRSDLAVLMKYMEALINKANCRSDTILHMELNLGNVLFTGERFMVIDGDLSLGDPYYDLSRISLCWCPFKEIENVFMKSYLGRTPSSEEMKKLELFKKILMFRFILGRLSELPEKDELNFIDGKKPSFLDFCISMKGKIDTDEKKLMLASILRDALFEDLNKEKRNGFLKYSPEKSVKSPRSG